MSKHYPVLQKLGYLAPDRALTNAWREPNFEMAGFSNGADYTKPFLDFLKATPYEPHDYCDRGMLFSSRSGVSMHTDDYPSVLWVLDSKTTEDNPNTLLVGSKRTGLRTGDVFLFDARREHGVIATSTEIWTIFSTYVRHRRTSSAAAAA